MQYDVISFDLQGTLSDSAFSDECWRELLPKLYGEKFNVSLTEAKRKLAQQFKEIGRYDKRYYCFDSWIDLLNLFIGWKNVVDSVENKAALDPKMKSLVMMLQKQYPLLLFSATTHQFLYHELAELKSAFTWIYSAIDDLRIAGKTPEAFAMVAEQIKVDPQRILHIGDDPEMDVQNAKAAGWNAILYSPENREELWKTFAIA